MDRRKYLKTLAAGTITTGLLLDACAPEKTADSSAATAATDAGPDRLPEEIDRYKKLSAETFFNEHEMSTIRVLADIIIPRDDVSGSATDAKVPEFIEFIVKDIPRHQLPMRGGLKWLDVQCLKRFENTFVACTPQQQIEMVDEIAWPEKAKPEMKQGVAFFNTMRDLPLAFLRARSASRTWATQEQPNQWDGVPQDVLDQYGVKYDDRTLKESVKFES